MLYSDDAAKCLQAKAIVEAYTFKKTIKYCVKSVIFFPSGNFRVHLNNILLISILYLMQI